MKRRANWYAIMCGQTYWDLRRPQLARLDESAIGYAADERLFYDREPRVLFRDVLIQTGREHTARKLADSAVS